MPAMEANKYNIGCDIPKTLSNRGSTMPNMIVDSNAPRLSVKNSF